MSEKRQLWYVFCGMGCQWNGMGKELMVLEPFSKAIFRCAEVLRPEGIDLIKIINDSDEKTFDNVLNSFVAIAAVQIGLVDVLKSLGLRPDGIIGHSVGELGCAYADGGFTAEQTILAAYWRGKSIQDSPAGRGSMAVVGLSWDEAQKIVPEGVYAVCNNSADNVTLSAPTELMEPLLERLSADGIFTRKANSSGYAFHSKYIADAGPKLLSSLEKIIPEPKPRTKRWISTSIPESEWSSELASTSSAAYHVHNLLSPVLFYQGVCHIPDGSLVVEIAPHHLLRPLLVKSLPNCTVLGLVKREIPDGIEYLLKTLGRIYLEGIEVDMRGLYPKVSYPVGRNTAMISPMVKWDHSTQWQVPLFVKQNVKFGESVIEADISKDKDSYITGHEIDGRVIYPATGYLVLVWNTFAKTLGKQMEETPVIFEDVEIRNATIMTKNGAVKFVVSIFEASGQFEISVSGTTALTGSIKLMDKWEGLPSMQLKKWEHEEYILETEDFYKDLRLRGYNYGGLFKGIRKINISGDYAEAEWRDNWTAFVDTLLQVTVFSRDKALELPVRILKVIIDPQRHLNETKINKGMNVAYNKVVEIIQCGGIEIRGVKTATTPRRQDMQSTPELEKYCFVPYIDNNIDGIEDAIGAVLQIVNENSGAVKIKVMEIIDKEDGEPLAPMINRMQMKEPHFSTDITICTPTPGHQERLEDSGINVTKRKDANKFAPNVHLIVGDSVPDGNEFSEELNQMKPYAFYMYHGDKSAICKVNTLIVIAKFQLKDRTIVLYRKPGVYVKPKVVHVTNTNYSWVEDVKKGMEESEKNNTKILLVSQGEPTCGIIGMINCLRMEPGGNNLRCMFIQDVKANPFSLSSEVYSHQLEKDLFSNVLSPDGHWGSYRHFKIPPVRSASVKTENAFVNVLTRGDLAGLSWIQGPKSDPSTSCTVYYASLNFRDIMIATGQLSADSLPGKLARQDCILGLEFSGRNPLGERVMGAVDCRGLATTVTSDPILTWHVPERWTLQEAASVPIVYATAYYSLMVRGSMKPGESVLIHAGTGGVGQAAINIALHMGCKVFTTVGTEEKRQFIKKTYPQLNDKCIGNSRDTSFEQLVLSETNGRGVDLVLNSLSDEKLQSSIRCLAQGGRFLEIGKLDLSKNTALGMAVFLKNASVHGVLLDSFMSEDCDKWEKQEIHRLVSEGIVSGAVRPIPQTTFNRDQIETAFRYMATGKHIGKVIIKIREEESSGVNISKVLYDVIPRTFLDNRKSYIILGGLGGFGLELADWIITRNARKIILVSRSGVQNGFQMSSIRRMERNGATVIISNKDTTSVEGAISLLKEAESLGPVGGIFNLAAVLRDAFMENQTEKNFKEVCNVKVATTLALDAASRSCKELDYFVVFSSVSCGRGNPGQSNYGYGNSAMERICEARKALGLPATAIEWGAIGDIGIVMDQMKKSNDDVIAGTIPQRIVSCLAVLDYFLQRPEPVLSSMVVPDKGKSKDSSNNDSILRVIANILGLKDPNSCLNKTFAELGMDSLMGTEVKQKLERDYDLILSAQEIRALTFQKLLELSAGDSQTSSDTVKKGVTFKSIIPKEVIVKMPSKTLKDPTEKAIFFIHPIEGHVFMLEEVTGQVEGAVFGLQCSKDVPLESNEQLAAYYIQKITAIQKDGPYLIVGYSFGTIIALEIGLQLEKLGHKTSLVMIDGSPAFFESHKNLYKLTKGFDEDFDAFRLSYLALMYNRKDFLQVQKEMLQLESWDLRLKRCSEIMSPFTKQEILEGDKSFIGKLNLASGYKLNAKLNGDITLIKASESYIDIGDDYELKQYCKGKFMVHTVMGCHKKILEGKSSTIIADIINQSSKSF